jgi:hypothetical protein
VALPRSRTLSGAPTKNHLSPLRKNSRSSAGSAYYLSFMLQRKMYDNKRGLVLIGAVLLPRNNLNSG